jgi:hypothetical protein
MAQSNLKAPVVVRLPGLLEDLHTGALCIPPFQRDFEWTGDQRIALCGSVLLGLPTGSLMVWRTSHVLAVENPIGPYPVAPSSARAKEYLLDGRQRMTTLYAALAAGLWTQRGEEVPAAAGATAPDGTPWALMYDLEKQDFVFDNRETESDVPLLFEKAPPLLPLAVLLDDTAYDEWRGGAGLSRELTNRARALRSAFVDYLIPVVPLVTDDISIVTLTFKRVNSGGTPMGDADMTRALAWSGDFDLRNHLSAAREELKPRGWGEVEDDAMLKVVAAVAGLDPTEFDPEALASRIKANPSLVHKAGDRVSGAVDLLRQGLGIAGPGSLPYTQILVSVARAIDGFDGILSPHSAELLVAWAAEACIDERFGGAPAHMVRAYWRGLAQRLGLPGDPPARERGRRKANECRVFSMAWARSRGTALVLAAQSPCGPNGDAFVDPAELVAHGTDHLGMLVAEGADGLPGWVVERLKKSRGPSAALRSPANRFICPPIILPVLRRAIFRADCSKAILDGHLIRASAHRALIGQDLDTFFEDRREAILEAEKRWVEDRKGEVEIVPYPRRYSEG